MRHNRTISRRQFIKSASVAAVGSTLLLKGQETLARLSAGRSRVILVRDAAVLDNNAAPKPDVVGQMLDQGLKALTGKPDALMAWKSIVKPRDVVGIKSNVWAYLPTTAAVEQSIKKRLMDAGVREENIGIDDRGVRSSPLFQRSTALINVRPMRSHHWSGVGGLIKNYIMFIPDPLTYHPDSCASLAAIWGQPICKGKTRLGILTMLTPQFHSFGPHSFNPKYVWKYYGILMGFDPVAVDTMGLRIIEAMRREHFGEERPLSPPATHIEVADTRYHLGTADPQKIDFIKIGYEKDILV